MEESERRIVEEARAAFYENAQKGSADRYRIEFKAGWVKIGKPFMVQSQREEFVVWVEGGGVEISDSIKSSRSVCFRTSTDRTGPDPA